MGMEEGIKDNAASAPNSRSTNQFKALLPMRVLQVFLLFFVLVLGISVISMHMIKYLNIQTLAPSTLISPYDERITLESFIKPPASVWHSMNDSELLWRASMEPRILEYPFKRVPKMAFMFLTKGPLPFSPLWERFFKGHEGFYSIYVHALPDYRSDFPSSSVFYRRQIPSQHVAWGEMSMCDAERRLLANALLDISNEWFVLLSEACIPIRGFNFVYRYVSRSRYSFMGSVDEDGPYGRGRYSYAMGPEVSLSEWRKGSQWFEINRALAVEIVEDMVYYHKFKEFCRPPCYVDEHYFPTMLSIGYSDLLANRTLTWTDWSRGGAHPATFGKADITERFLKKLSRGQACFYNDKPSQVCYLFARKFSPSALEPLLKLAPKVLGF
ncbi:Glycosyl transferase family 14 [Arabidopsis thaliana x Arabidopsis arenosa]|uniref:Glycosyl transferase family 14 n=1 Tax=Arabidopsis thaliana x Arabidopsis arenosa TaxID=1240361 RepID=A0A8T2AVB6_9BRAS|nr:Glycosyl transferase family 14 [Arabidopsis thaliana x Arabidopsis arenosa]KAG7578129.1 Glycosyl transferase family 14 [Arabidopsis thaliana x Arabidopsis arenosa]